MSKICKTDFTARNCSTILSKHIRNIICKYIWYLSTKDVNKELMDCCFSMLLKTPKCNNKVINKDTLIIKQFYDIYELENQRYFVRKYSKSEQSGSYTSGYKKIESYEVSIRQFMACSLNPKGFHYSYPFYMLHNFDKNSKILTKNWLPSDFESRMTHS